MDDDTVIESLKNLRENYITLPEHARVAGMLLAKEIENTYKLQLAAISQIIVEIENITKDAN